MAIRNHMLTKVQSGLISHSNQCFAQCLPVEYVDTHAGQIAPRMLRLLLKFRDALILISDIAHKTKGAVLFVYSNGIEAHSDAAVDIRVNLHGAIEQLLNTGLGYQMQTRNSYSEAKDIDSDKVSQALKSRRRLEIIGREIRQQLPLGFEAPKYRKKPWGTGHAVLCAKDKITAPFAVINADDYVL